MTVDIESFRAQMRSLGYLTNNHNLLAQLALLEHDLTLARTTLAAVVLDGPPGTGKTYAAQTFAKKLKAEFLELQFTVGVGREVVMHDIDIAAVVTRQVDAMRAAQRGEEWHLDPDELVIPGILQVALTKSHTGPVVLLLDELDKAKSYVDAMLLQFLNDGAIAHPTERGRTLRGNPNNLVVFITKNNERRLSEPLMRRCRSVYLAWPGEDTEVAMVKQMALKLLKGQLVRGDIEAAAKAVVGFANKIRTQELTLTKVPSSPELAQAVVDMLRVPKEHRGVVVCRQLFKYRDDYQDYNADKKDSSLAVTEERVRSMLAGI